jgi:hypothetical protein
MKDRVIITGLWYLLCLTFKLYRAQATTARQHKMAETWGFRLAQWRRQAELSMESAGFEEATSPLPDYHAEAD